MAQNDFLLGLTSTGLFRFSSAMLRHLNCLLLLHVDSVTASPLPPSTTQCVCAVALFARCVADRRLCGVCFSGEGDATKCHSVRVLFRFGVRVSALIRPELLLQRNWCWIHRGHSWSVPHDRLPCPRHACWETLHKLEPTF